MTTEIQNVVAHRSLDRKRPDGATTKVDVIIGDVSLVRGETDDEADSWQAWVEITGADRSDLHVSIYGEDSMQAVHLAMKFAGRILDDCKCAREIKAFGSRGETRFGFPVFRKKIRHIRKPLSNRP